MRRGCEPKDIKYKQILGNYIFNDGLYQRNNYMFPIPNYQLQQNKFSTTMKCNSSNNGNNSNNDNNSSNSNNNNNNMNNNKNNNDNNKVMKLQTY